MEDLHSMMEVMMIQMKKLDKLDIIEEKLKSFENELQGVKDKLNFVHAEVEELKKSGTAHKESVEELKSKVQILENENTRLNNSVIDLKARSMRDNLLFFNIDEPIGEKKEDTTEIILALLENKLEIPDARNKIKIDRSDRLHRPEAPKYAKWSTATADHQQVTTNCREIQ
jgi:chromosome segregation ATPase